VKYWYYLHTNGDLIPKHFAYDPSGSDFMDSDFVQKFWLVDTNKRFEAWALLAESLACGANLPRVQELAEKWGCNESDFVNFCEMTGMKLHKTENGFTVTWGDKEPLEPGDTKPSLIEALASLVGKGDLTGKFRKF